MHQADALFIVVTSSLHWVLWRLYFKVNVHFVASKLNELLQERDSLTLPKIIGPHLIQGLIKDVVNLSQVLEVMIQFTIVSSVKDYGNVVFSEPNLYR